jgi:hypothetical protein
VRTSKQACKVGKKEGKKIEACVMEGRRNSRKRKKKLPQYKTTNNLNILKKNQLLEELSSERAFTNVRGEKGETGFFLY